VLKEEIGLRDPFKMDGKKRGDDLDYRDHRLGRRLGLKCLRAVKTIFALLIEISRLSQKSLNPMKQFGKKIGDEKCIGEDQCPKRYPLKTDFNSSTLFRFLNPKKFLGNHLPFHRQFRR